MEPLTPFDNGEMVVAVHQSEKKATLFVGNIGNWRLWRTYKDSDYLPDQFFWVGDKSIGVRDLSDIRIYDRQTLKATKTLKIPPEAYLSRVDVSPNGKRILLLAEQPSFLIGKTTSGIVIDIKTGRQSRRAFQTTRFGDDMWYFSSRTYLFYRDSAWLPDNKHFIVLVPRILGGNDLWLVDSSSPKPLKRRIATRFYSAAWTPN